MIQILHALALLGYLAAAAVLATSLVRGRATAPRSATLLLAGSLAIHTGALAFYTVQHGELPLVGLAPSLSTFALVVGLFLLAAQSLRELRPIGLVVVPLMSVMVAVALVVGIAPSGAAPAFRGWWMSLHVVLAFIGFAGLAVACAGGLLYLLQLRELEGKHFGRVFRFLPSLDGLEGVMERALGVGLTALTGAILLGWAWTVRFRNSLDLGDPKVLWAVFAWVVMAVAFASRGGGPRRQRRSALVSVLGFGLVVLAYVVLRGGLVEGRMFF